MIKDVILEYVRGEYIEEGDDRELNYDTPLISGGIVHTGCKSNTGSIRQR